MKISFLPFLILWLTFFSNCNSDDAEPECEPILVNPYENCCGVEPLEAVLGTGEIFVPNIFTPNADGFNDIFYPFTNDDISSILSFVIKDDAGQEIFQKLNLQAGPFPNVSNGWDGTDGQGNLLFGLFDYEITFSNIDNQEATYTGKVCSIKCGENVVPSENATNCGFPTQHNGQGNLDPNLPNFEAECF